MAAFHTFDQFGPCGADDYPVAQRRQQRGIVNADDRSRQSFRRTGVEPQRRLADSIMIRSRALRVLLHLLPWFRGRGRSITGRERKDEERVAAARARLPRQGDEAGGGCRGSGTRRHVLPAVEGVGDGKAGNGRPEVDLPEHRAGLLVESPEAAVDVAAEDEPAAGRDQRHGRGPLLVDPERPSGLGVHGPDARRDSPVLG